MRKPDLRLALNQEPPPPKFPKAKMSKENLLMMRTVNALAPLVGLQLREAGASQDDINDYYTEVRRCDTIREAVDVTGNWVTLEDSG